MVWRFVCARVSGDEHLAEDIVSETVLALIKAAASTDTEINNPGAWLRTVANNKINDHFRAAARVQHLIDQVKHTTELANTHDGASHQEQREQRETIRGALQTLPDQFQLALEWKYIDKLNVREIAQRLDVTEKAAESLLFRARRDFRSRLTLDDVGDAVGGESGKGPPSAQQVPAPPVVESESRSESENVAHNDPSSTETRIPINHSK